jgi:uncharacterized membrane protein YvbJ
MFFETAFGICIGCKIYNLFNNGKAQYCPGEICDTKTKQEIQKISLIHWAIVLVMIAIVLLIAVLFNDTFSEKPNDLFDLF